MYCVRCKTKTGTKNEKLVTTTNNKTMKRGSCARCGTTKRSLLNLLKVEAY